MAEHEAARTQLPRLLADLLDYPAPGIAETAGRCEEMLGSLAPGAVPGIRTFRAFAEQTPLGRMEELYTGFFDLNPVCFPYVGYHLFGESYKRSTFLLALMERYQAQGFEVSRTDLADRLSVVLRFVSECGDEEERAAIITEGVIPALKRMTGKQEPEGEDASATPPAGAEQGAPQLEGHSEGEVLAAGFLLGLTEGTATSAEPGYAYRLALDAARIALEVLWPSCTAIPTATRPGREEG